MSQVGLEFRLGIRATYMGRIYSEQGWVTGINIQNSGDISPFILKKVGTIKNIHGYVYFGQKIPAMTPIWAQNKENDPNISPIRGKGV